MMLRTRVRVGPWQAAALSIVVALLFTALHTGMSALLAVGPGLGAHLPFARRTWVPPALLSPQATATQAPEAHGGEPPPAGAAVAVGHLDHGAALELGAASARSRAARSHERSQLVALFVVFLTLISSVTQYLRNFGQSRLRLLRSQIGIFAGMLLLGVLAVALLVYTPLPPACIPVATVPLWISTGFDRRTGLLVAVALGFVVATFVGFDPLTTLALVTQGLAASLFYSHRKRGLQMLLAGVLAGVGTAVLITAVGVIVHIPIPRLLELSNPLHSVVLACLGGGVLAGSLAALSTGPAHRLLGAVSREKLLDLTDIDQPLLRKMAAEAPGSWEHARAMANLAEAAASAVGADALLTRVGAYYHDLGKTHEPKYFVENLGHEEPSPHDGLAPEESARIIVAHVERGTRILREGGIPEPVVEFAYTHHGTQRVEYFYSRCLEQGNPNGVDAKLFQYPGMRPQTKETAILMLVDSIEAASRTVEVPSRDEFQTVIQRVVFTKLESGQLDECGLDMADLRIVIQRMTEILVNMHHHRVKYPWQAKRAQEFGVPARAVSRPVPPSRGVSPSPPPSAVSPVAGGAAPPAPDRVRSATVPPARRPRSVEGAAE